VTGTGTILLWGLPADRPIEAVRDALQQAGCRVTLLDQRAVRDTEVELAVGSSVEGRLRVREETFDLAAVKAVYLRPYDSRELPDVARAGPSSELWRHALAVQDILSSWAELTPARVLNRPSSMAANGSKPYQASWIESLGFRIPDTLITTDPDIALEFWRQNDKVIYKSVSGIRSIVSQLTAEHMRRFDDIASCPTQFQQYVPGTEYRVHVVGEEVFACRIVSEADDYRYSTEGVDMQPCDLPGDVAALCRALARSMNLLLAGLDLRCTPEGRWYCFEVNPSPGFTYFQKMTGQPIAEAVARLLASGPEKGRLKYFGNHPPKPAFCRVEGPLVLSRAIRQHEVLRLQECETTRDRVFALREYWTRRSDGECFFTLGAAAYLDAPANREPYLRAAGAINPVLRESFEWLYQRVRTVLEELLGQPVCYDNECALPGFHIFVFRGEDQSSDKPFIRAHFDGQWMDAMPGCQPEETLSFTLPIEQPSGGSSLEIWPVHSSNVVPGLDARQYASKCPSQTLRYSRGYMVVHDGLLLHAIGGASIATPEGHRITFQGHGIKTSGSWKLYW